MMFRKWFLVAISISMLALSLVAGLSTTDAQQATPAAKPATDPTPPPPIKEEEEVFKVNTDAVNILFTAQDHNHRLITSLKPEDIKVFENGQPQEIAAFSRQVDLPLSLAILIDTSISQQRTLPEEKEAAISFLESVVRPTKDEVSIISFTGDSTLEQGMTNNLTRLRRAVDHVEFVPPSGYIGGGVVAGTPPISGKNQATAGSTAIWDSIWVTSDEVLGPAPDKTRRAIILLTDGYDTSSRKKLDEAVQAAQRAEAVVYTIGIGDKFYDGVNQGVLNKVSERTGGKAYFPKDEVELRDAFKQIEVEMRSQYLVAYEPTNAAKDGSYRTIEIQLVNQQLQKDKVKLTHRQGYFAKNESKK
jgi:Ca-activated chloride channel family protein